MTQDESTGNYFMQQSQAVIDIWLERGIYEIRNGRYYQKGTNKEIRPY